MTDDPSTVTKFSADINNYASNIVGTNASKKRKTNADYQKEYRARKKAKRDRPLDDLATAAPSTSFGESTTLHSSMIINSSITTSTHADSINSNKKKQQQNINAIIEHVGKKKKISDEYGTIYDCRRKFYREFE
ncbi:hypothetical protein PV326_000091 [Microctonus aethiopoides]|nr:hypothetical protein PV326_000091 [Microctonus aethiopoides]